MQLSRLSGGLGLQVHCMVRLKSADSSRLCISAFLGRRQIRFSEPAKRLAVLTNACMFGICIEHLICASHASSEIIAGPCRFFASMFQES